MSLRTRVTERLEALGLTPQAASLQAGLGRDAVRNILRGRSVSASPTTLAALAPVLGVTASWLGGYNDGPQAVMGELLQVKHCVGAGYWAQVGEAAQGEVGMVLSDPSMRGFGQWLERVVGVDMDREYPPGTLLHVVEPAAINHAPRPGDHVVISRARDNEEERLVREVVAVGERLMLRTNTSYPKWEGTTPLDEALVVGLVLGSYRPRK